MEEKFRKNIGIYKSTGTGRLEGIYVEVNRPKRKKLNN